MAKGYKEFFHKLGLSYGQRSTPQYQQLQQQIAEADKRSRGQNRPITATIRQQVVSMDSDYIGCRKPDD